MTGEIWEFLCSKDKLCTVEAAGPFFHAALQPDCWQEGELQELCFDEEDALCWQWILLRVHGWNPDARDYYQDQGSHSAHLVRPSLLNQEEKEQLFDQDFHGTYDIHFLVRLLALCKKYLIDESEHDILRRLRESSCVPLQLAALSKAEIRELARELEFLGILQHLLGPWCLGHGSAMAKPIEVLLEAGGSLADAVLNSKGASVYIATGDFLEHRVSQGNSVLQPLLYLAEAGGLELLKRCLKWNWLQGPEQLEEVLEEEMLMPLTQLPALRKELRLQRFRAPKLVSALEPFPQLCEELLNYWFEVPRAEAEQRHPDVEVDIVEKLQPLSDRAESLPVTPPGGLLSTTELVAWAECRRFRRREELLEAHVAVAKPQALMTFLHTAPLKEIEVIAVVQKRIKLMASEAWKRSVWLRSKAISRCEDTNSVILLLSNAPLLKHLWYHKAVQLRTLYQALFAILLPVPLLPFRSTWIFWKMLWQHPSRLFALWRPSWWSMFARAAALELHGALDAVAALQGVASLLAKVAVGRLRASTPFALSHRN
eukprot:TRINITY_DN50516_c0_g1_i1.p1 TRINITY_DN50516_c0_g1~~TRINITY_DN50516_c0_g1_i1.p1  ORF type:complete len:575 (-),score=100.75 TRINITY_DN50516_c0_g1_i1:381-2006(-)